MKIELNQNKIFFNNGKSVQEIHPFWLRERVDGDEYLDKGTQQRLFDPSQMDGEIIIKKAQIKNGILEVGFNDGVNSKLDLNKLESEFSDKDIIIKTLSTHWHLIQIGTKCQSSANTFIQFGINF